MQFESENPNLPDYFPESVEAMTVGHSDEHDDNYTEKMPQTGA